MKTSAGFKIKIIKAAKGQTGSFTLKFVDNLQNKSLARSEVLQLSFVRTPSSQRATNPDYQS